MVIDETFVSNSCELFLVEYGKYQLELQGRHRLLNSQRLGKHFNKYTTVVRLSSESIYDSY